MSHTFPELLASKGLRGLPIAPPYVYDPSSPNPTQLLAALQQFMVETAARYAQDEHTYCNIFLEDGLGACSIDTPPHWAWPDGTPATPYATRLAGNGVTELAHEINANDTFDWLQQNGARFGWKEASAAEAQLAADAGAVAIFAWKNPKTWVDAAGVEHRESGHVGFVRPSLGRPGIWFAQAGLTNSTDVAMSRVFRPQDQPTFYVRSNA